MSKPRTRLFNHTVPLVTVQGTDVSLKPDLLLVIEGGRIRTARRNPVAPINRIISLLGDLLEELKDDRYAEEIRKSGKTLKKK
jgi:hypothetical protein